MKKQVAGAVLAGALLRVAVLAGAGDAVADWVRDLDAEGRAVTATLNIELAPRETPANDEAPMPAAEPEPEPELLLVAVTPPPTEPPQEAAPEPEPEPEPVLLPADLSCDDMMNNRTGFAVDPAELLTAGPTLRLAQDGPQVLIIHTHSSEAYTPDELDRYEASDPYRTEDKAYSVIRVGDALTEALEGCGLTVLHDREIYDYPSYTGSYNRSGAAVERILAEQPTIRVVIDLHRDALGSGGVVYKTRAELEGRSSAQVMMVVGTGENGLSHPNWRGNLSLALYLQRAVESRYPTLTRPIELVPERYNQHLAPGMLILEVGSNGNTLREAITAAELFGETAGPALAALIADD